ncbi:MAG: hypothetical protein ACJ8EH_12565 [Sphingomicrobium sp.]
MTGASAWGRVIDSLRMMKAGTVVLLALAATCAGARGTVMFARGAWAAIDRGAACEALSRSQRVAPKDKVQAIAGLTFTVDHRRWGEFHARLSRIPRADASVMLKVGDQPFLLTTRAGWAWSRGPMQAQAIIAAMRTAPAMRVESRDAAGVRFSDPYLLDGAPTAIDAAAARCALRGAGKIR